MSAQENYDIAVIGGGPGGYVASIRAAQLGLSVVCIEREHLGGICLNWGCIPTKALLRSSEMYHHINQAEKYGLRVGEASLDMESIVKRSRAAAAKLNQGIEYLLKKNNVDTIYGRARITAGRTVEIEDSGGDRSVLTAKHIILATGARARELPRVRADGEAIWTYREAMVPETLPESLLVIGSGAIGMEFASFYSDLGSRVTVVEMLDRILPAEDADISRAAEKIFTNQGIQIHTSSSVEGTARENGRVKTICRRRGETYEIATDKVILAAGIIGNVEGLGLEEAGVVVENGHVVTDEWGHTGVNGLWAIGDMAGGPWLAHKASHEAVVAVERIAGLELAKPMDTNAIPSCTYCRPQVARIGLTEKRARDSGHEVKIGQFPFSANGKAIALDETEGFVKTVFDAGTGELLGAHMIGTDVTELIQGYVIAMRLEATEAELMDTVFPHPTLSESMHESVLKAFRRAIHM